MATYDKAAVASAKTLLQQDNDSWESLPKYEGDHKPAYLSSTLSTIHTVNIVPSGLQKLKSRLSAAKEARDRRVSLYEAWQRKLPTLYAKQTYPTAESYPPHRVEFARQQRHQSWYPHYQSSTSDCDAKPDASKVEELSKVTSHQSWYPHYKTSDNDSYTETDAEKVEDLKKETRHQSWYPHYKMSTPSSDSTSAELDSAKTEDLTEPNRHQSWYPHYKPSNASSNASADTLVVEDLKKERCHQSWYPHYASSHDGPIAKPDASKVQDRKKPSSRHQSWYPHFKPSSSSSSSSSGADVAAAKIGSLKERVLFRVSRITDLGIDEGLKAAYPKYTEIEC